MSTEPVPRKKVGCLPVVIAVVVSLLFAGWLFGDSEPDPCREAEHARTVARDHAGESDNPAVLYGAVKQIECDAGR